MSHTYVAAFVALLAGLLPLMGFEIVDNETFTSNITNIITVCAALWAVYGRVRLGDISWTGFRKR